MKKKNKIILGVSLGLLALIGIILNLHYKYKQIDHLKMNYKLVSGRVYEIWIQHKSGNSYVKYDFEFNRKYYSGERGLGGISASDATNYFLGKSFSVLVDSTDPENNAILITPFHFEKMQWAYPDSLNWVRKYYSKNFITDW